MRHTEHHQTINGLDRIDRVATCDGNAGTGTDIVPAFQDLTDRFLGQDIDGHAHQGQRKNGRRAHGINIGNGIRRRNATKIVRVIHDRHKEIRGRHQGLLVV